MKKILISACLAGDRVRYDGKQVPFTNALLLHWRENGRLVNLCPEVFGGLEIPRSPAEIVKGNGRDVLNGTAKVVNNKGKDVTLPFIRGAEYALSLTRKKGIKMAVLKEKSPSCGVNTIYDGSFASRLIKGFGVTAAILMQNNVRVFSENELDQARAFFEET